MINKSQKLILKSAKIKIICIGLIFGFIFACFSSYLTYQYMGKTKDQRLLYLKQAVQIARNSIEPILMEYCTQNISMENALEQVRNLIRRMVYNDHIGKNYIFMSTYDGIMLVQPFEPEKEMTNLWDLQDSRGLYIIRSLVKAAKSKEGQGYVSYHYQRPGHPSTQEKISFVIGIPELGCYIGTGQYMADLRKGQLIYIIKIVGLTFVLMSLLFFLVRASMKEIRAQNAMLHKAERELEAIFHNTFQFIATLSTEGRLTKINRSALNFFKQDESSVVGKPLWDTPWWQKDDKAQFKKAVRECSKGVFCRFETTNIRSNKEKYFIDFSLTPIFDEKRNVISLLAEGRDITDQKRAQEEKRSLEKRLNQAQKMETIGTLAGGIAHDFNNILFPIIGHTEMLIEDIQKNSPFQKSLNEIYISALRAKDLIKQILTFSRQEHSDLKLMKIQPIIEEALNFIRSTIPTTIDIKQDIQADCGLIKADPTQIHQVIMNLTTNAYHAMEYTGGELKVSLKEVKIEKYSSTNLDPGAYACLIVADEGIGMDKNLVDKIFDPFFTTKEKGKGTGMGLSVVHGIVKNLNGDIQVSSVNGKGTEFYIYIPVEKSSSK